jgi:hypothetical protein
MASFYDSASIITIPSGYKVGTLYSAKPTDGTGDMSFTRTGNTATRVNSAGIIERCITNVLLQSNNFSTTWANSNLTIVGSITDPNGGTTAFSIAGTSADSNLKSLTQGAFPVSTDFKTVSVYAKANTHNFLQVRLGNTGTYVNFDLSTGTLSNGTNAVGTMTSLGGGWYRCICATTIAASSTNAILVLVDSLSALASDNSTTTNSIYIWRSQAQTGDQATNYIDTTTAAVTQGPVTNLPRLDYFGSTCPQLLMEPTRTNLVTYSQMINAWTKTNDTSVSGNVVVSPDGYSNADLIISSNNFSTNRATNTFTAVSGTTYAFSGFVKQGPDNAPVAIRMLSSSNANLAGINIVFTAGVPAITATGLALNAKAESFGNGWYRISGTYVAPASETNRFAYYADTDGTNKSSYFWGAQLEAGAYATSYIPTTAATVTRNADSAFDTGISSLLGQTEGTVLIDMTFTPNFVGRSIFVIDVNATTNFIHGIINNLNRVVFQIRQSGSNTNIITSSALSLGRHKIAFAYKSGDYALYIDGVQIGTSNSTVYPVGTLNQLVFSSATYGNLEDRLNQALVFKTRLSNADLATLTTL